MSSRIAIFGTESTGKTTLAHQLAERFAAPWAAEYVREFWYARGGDIRASDLTPIAQGQIDNEEAAAARAEQLVICDTELLTNTLWADLLFPGQCPAWVRKAAQRRCHNYALYLLCDTDIAFVDDGQRCFPEAIEREYCRRIWRATLVDRDLPFVDIRGPLDVRLATAGAAIECVTGIAPRS
jgi:NadR type nicotinamide-nucleotide adenylyltransferase